MLDLTRVGSAVIMPEVFLKALSISRNLGHGVAPLYTASFDIREDITDYYFRPGKNVVRRPVSLGGEGFIFRADHRQSIPSLHRKLLELSGGGTPPATHSAPPRATREGWPRAASLGSPRRVLG